MIYECRITVYNFVKFVNEGADGDEEAKGADGPSFQPNPVSDGVGGSEEADGG